MGLFLYEAIQADNCSNNKAAICELLKFSDGDKSKMGNKSLNLYRQLLLQRFISEASLETTTSEAVTLIINAIFSKLQDNLHYKFLRQKEKDLIIALENFNWVVDLSKKDVVDKGYKEFIKNLEYFANTNEFWQGFDYADQVYSKTGIINCTPYISEKENFIGKLFSGEVGMFEEEVPDYTRALRKCLQENPVHPLDFPIIPGFPKEKISVNLAFWPESMVDLTNEGELSIIGLLFVHW